MAQQLINLGSVGGDGTGTKLRAGGDIINDNFTELYEGKLNLDQTTPQTIVNGAPVFEAIDFNTSPTIESNVIGRLKWAEAEESLEYGVEGGTIDVNKEIYDIYVDKNDNLAEGNVVSVVDISGNRQSVEKTDNTDRNSALSCIGMVTHKKINGKVRVTKKGRVRGVNTNGMTEGMPVYANSTGGFTQTVPTVPDYFIHVGIVEVANTNNGIIDVDIRVVYNLEDLSDVDSTVTTVDDADLALFKVSNIWRKISWSNIKTLLKTYFDSIYTTPYIPIGTYIYHNQSASEDTIGDWRTYADDNGFYTQYCTVGNATKGAGTWVTKFTIQV